MYTTFWRNKYLADADTIEGLAAVLKEASEELLAMHKKGIQLERVGDDYYLLSTDDAVVAHEFGLEEEEDDEADSPD